jgi:hypothetical protein
MFDDIKFKEEVAADIKAKVKSFDFKTIEKLKKAKDESGTFDVIISTEDIDRSGEIVRQNGWELTNYKNNPIVLWGHDYYNLPIGVCTETYLTEKDGVPALGARGFFLPADINPLAQQVRKLYDLGITKGEGVGCTTSVGFIPKEFDESNRSVITKAELLEFSFVPVPANQGVGPARGRAVTFEEARELNLDMTLLVKKGVPILEAEKKDKDEKAGKPGDACETDDGSPGVFTSDPKDPDGPLVCLPQDQDKSAKADNPGKTRLLASVAEEHGRHADEVAKSFDNFQKAVAEDRGEEEPNEDESKKAKRLSDDARAMRTNLKDLRSALSDEHTMHRAKSIADFRSFDPTDKSFNKDEHLKALRDQHDAYEAKCMKSLDSFEEKCMKSVQGTPGDVDNHTDWITGKMETHQNVHQKAVTKIAKGMCKSAFGEEDEADEKTLAVIKEFLTPHVDAQLLPAVAGKLGSKLIALHREKLGEAHQQLKAATAIVAGLHGGLGNDDGEESRSVEEPTSPSVTAPRKQRSRPTEDAGDEELNAHLLAKDILRGITTSAQKGLETLNKRGK